MSDSAFAPLTAQEKVKTKNRKPGKDAVAASKFFTTVLEYYVPKIQRVEQQQLDEDGNPASARRGLDIEHDRQIIEMFADKFLEKQK